MEPATISSSVPPGEAVANLSVISYEQLLNNNPQESKKLLSACTDYGFFYLDLTSSDTAAYRDIIKNVYQISRDYFDKPLEEKLEDANIEWGLFNICGYKPRSLDTGNIKGKKDGCEGLRVPANAFLTSSPDSDLKLPQAIEAHRSTFETFVKDSHAVSVLILDRLSTSLGLTGSSRLEHKHQAGKASTSTAVLQHYPFEGDLPGNTSAGHFAHTDTGSITILFNTQWGLQVCSPQGERWEYVPPATESYAIVNIGDTVKFLSDHQLKSCLHRVVPCSDRWISGSRYATIFFLRANNDVEFEDLQKQKWNALDWLNRKFLNYRSSHEVQMKTPMATGREGFVGLWNPPASTHLTP